MKLLFMFFLGLMSGCASADVATIERCLNKRGQPIVVASGFQLETKEIRTVSLYGLELGALTRLTTHAERVLVYTSDTRFAQHVGYHFSDLTDPAAHVGWTMFATLRSGTVLDILRFDAAGLLIDERQVVIDVAYFEEGTAQKLVRIQPKR